VIDEDQAQSPRRICSASVPAMATSTPASQA
jgi:hypothetical protein